MERITDAALVETATKFHPPRYNALPDMGLYLEQTTKYINQCLAPLGCITVTSSMIRNYVKMGLVKNPVNKQYGANHIAHLICIAILKTVISLEQIGELFRWQQQVYSDETAYDYFFMEMENVLLHRFGQKGSLEAVGQTESAEKEMLHSAIVAVSHIIYLNACFRWMERNK